MSPIKIKSTTQLVDLFSNKNIEVLKFNKTLCDLFTEIKHGDCQLFEDNKTKEINRVINIV